MSDAISVGLQENAPRLRWVWTVGIAAHTREDPCRPRQLRRGGALGAIVFAIGFLANLFVFTRNFDTAEEVSKYLDDSKLLIFLGAIAVGVAGLGFLWFLTQLRAILAPIEDPPARLSALAFGGGVLFVGLWWVSMPVDVGVAAVVGPQLDHSVYQTLQDIAHWQFVYSQLAPALALLSVYLIARKTDVIPKWAIRFTAVVMVTTLLYDLATPIVLLLPVWAIVMGIAMLRTEGETFEAAG